MSAIEELLARSISALEKRNKPLPQRPQPKRPERLTNFFLPSSPPLPLGSSSWSPPPLSPNAPPSLSGFTLSPAPPAALRERRLLKQKPPLISKALEETIVLLEHENANLRQQNKVLHRQISYYKVLFEEYRSCQEKANEGMETVKSAKEAIERIAQSIVADVETYETARVNVQRTEKEANQDWKRFVDENAMLGVEIEKLAEDITKEHAMEITVYPYRGDPNMIM